MKQRKLIAVVAIVLVLVLCASVFVACNKDEDPRYLATTKTYKTYASSFATSWNVLDYETSDQGDMFSYSSSGFYEFDYKFDENGDVVDGQFTIVPVMASDYPTDITAEIAAEPDNDYLFDEEDTGYAWYIPVRKGMTWDNGDPIELEDWIYSMKEQLNPLFMNYRADSYYSSSTVIHNAKNYLYSGKTIMASDDGLIAAINGGADFYFSPAASNYLFGPYGGLASSYGILPTFDSLYNDYFVVTYEEQAAAAWEAGEDLADGAIKKADYDTLEAFTQAYVDYKFTGAGASPLRAAISEVYTIIDTLTPVEEGTAAGYYLVTDELLAALDAVSQGFFGGNYGWAMCSYIGQYPETTFDQVGLRTIDDGERYGLILILDVPYVDNGSHFVWAYDFGGNWLVKPDVYEACKVAPADGSELWTSTYGTSIETSPSYGPYKLTAYQTGKYYEFSKNDAWFGYSIPELSEGYYETDKIQCSLMEEWDTAWMAFQKGDLAGIGMDVKIADEYKTSARAYFTPDDYVNTVQIQTSIAAEPDDGIAKEILLNTKFRKALSLAIDRVEYAKQCTTSSLAGFGIYNSMHYYDVENGGVYRNTDIAKQVICDVYAVDVNDYDSLDDAYAAVVGYDLALAKQLVAEAIAEEIAAGTIKATDVLDITYGSSVDSEAARRPYNFLKAAWEKIFEGTQFAGTGFVFNYDGTHGDAYANDFKAGQYEVLSAGWSGAAWDPFYFMMAYIHDDYRYAQGWDPRTVKVTVTLNNVDPETGEWLGEGNGETASFTMDALTMWEELYEGTWAEGECNVENRLLILGALEKTVLESYCSIPVTYSFGAALRSYQIEAFTDTYNTFMGWGGIKYYSYNYNDGDWARYVDSQNGQLNYK
ncbi:MAG: hypothetical protein IJY49_00185 [Clostridia bacterium]|nr:hypothetical protein [Clostridia bacterium]